jgi:hypothetical protein
VRIPKNFVKLVNQIERYRTFLTKKNFEKWQNLEIAATTLIYQLKIGLDLPSKMSNDKEGLCFDFVVQKNPKLMTGHANGVITIL